MDKNIKGIIENFTKEGLQLYPGSIKERDNLFFSAALSNEGRQAVVFSESSFDPLLEGSVKNQNGLYYQKAPWSWETYRLFSGFFRWMTPELWPGKGLTFGFGERTGFLSSAHISAARKYGVFPVLAQQSVRELTAVGRTHKELVSDVAYSVFLEGYKEGYSADGDHIKTLSSLKDALAAGMTLITLDLSDFMDPLLAEAPDSVIVDAYRQFPTDYRMAVENRYSGNDYRFQDGKVHFELPAVRRCAALYYRAIEFIIQVDEEIRRSCQEPPALEISVDELPFKTTLAEHLFLMMELKNRNIKPQTLAIRFPCILEKGIDYQGDVPEAVKHFKGHFGITQFLGGYRLSIHSGSDKFSLFGDFARASGGSLHVKTAGTSWLEFLAVICREDWPFFKEVYRKARESFPDLRKKYSLSTDLAGVPEELDEKEAQQLLAADRGVRQLLHVSYPAFLGDPAERIKFWRFYCSNRKLCEEGIASHLERHLKALVI